MSDMNLPPFYVGQRVVALKNGFFHIKGEKYTVAEMMFCSSCKVWSVLTSENSFEPASIYHCDCGANLKSTIYVGGNAKYFAPIEENFQSISIEKVLEKETPLIGVN